MGQGNSETLSVRGSDDHSTGGRTQANNCFQPTSFFNKKNQENNRERTDTKVINFIGGPSAGKSTIAAQLFGRMKVAGHSCELVTEYPNDIVNRGIYKLLDDQIYVLGEQHQRMYCLKDKVEYIITDSPLILQLYYAKHNLKKYKDSGTHEDVYYAIVNLVSYLYNSYDNTLFWVDRNGRGIDTPDVEFPEYNGLVADKGIKEILEQYRFEYKTVATIEDVIANI